jgi:hypothetical protein
MTVEIGGIPMRFVAQIAYAASKLEVATSG